MRRIKLTPCLEEEQGRIRALGLDIATIQARAAAFKREKRQSCTALTGTCIWVAWTNTLTSVAVLYNMENHVRRQKKKHRQTETHRQSQAPPLILSLFISPSLFSPSHSLSFSVCVWRKKVKEKTGGHFPRWKKDRKKRQHLLLKPNPGIPSHSRTVPHRLHCGGCSHGLHIQPLL